VPRFHGKTGQVTVNGAVVAGISKWTLDQTTQKEDVSAFQDLNVTYVQGLPDAKGTISGWWDSVSTDTIYNVLNSTTPVQLVLTPTTQLGKNFSGPAFLDANTETDIKAGVKITANWVAAGPWTHT
jgi:hypothetical protein